MESCHISRNFSLRDGDSLSRFLGRQIRSGSPCSWFFSAFGRSRATLSTAVVAVIAEVRIAKDERRWTRYITSACPWRWNVSSASSRKNQGKKNPLILTNRRPSRQILDAFENQRYISKLIQWSLEASKHERRRPHLVGGDVDLELGNKMPLFLPALPYQAT